MLKILRDMFSEPKHKENFPNFHFFLKFIRNSGYIYKHIYRYCSGGLISKMDLISPSYIFFFTSVAKYGPYLMFFKLIRTLSLMLTKMTQISDLKIKPRNNFDNFHVLVVLLKRCLLCYQQMRIVSSQYIHF